MSIHDYWKTTALTRWTFVGKVMSLLFNMLSRLVIAFLPRSKHLTLTPSQYFSWLKLTQSRCQTTRDSLYALPYSQSYAVYTVMSGLSQGNSNKGCGLCLPLTPFCLLTTLELPPMALHGKLCLPFLELRITKFLLMALTYVVTQSPLCWVGQKVHLGFSAPSYRKTQMNFLTHPIN